MLRRRQFLRHGPRHRASVPSVEILGLYIVIDIGRNALGISLNQRGSEPVAAYETTMK